jgi:hypothetical protein
MAFILTARGIPIVYYGDEQYLHNDTNKGVDPYTRPWMSSFDQKSVGFQLVQKLTALRKTNDALAYGAMRALVADQNMYVFEREFAGSAVLVAINKNETTEATASDLKTAFAPGSYNDALGALLGGVALKVKEDGKLSVTLPPHSVSIWQTVAHTDHPEIGSIAPLSGEPGMEITLAGTHFGLKQGQVKFDSTPAEIISWSDRRVRVRVPKVKGGVANVVVVNATDASTKSVPFIVHQSRLVPVTFTLSTAPHIEQGEQLYVTGNVPEMGAWSTRTDVAPGPFLCPQTPACFLDISVPAGQALEYKYVVIGRDGNVRWQEKKAHQYAVPEAGTGRAESSGTN